VPIHIVVAAVPFCSERAIGALDELGPVSCHVRVELRLVSEAVVTHIANKRLGRIVDLRLRWPSVAQFVLSGVATLRVATACATCGLGHLMQLRGASASTKRTEAHLLADG
jgi:hypothetical protein